MGCLTLCRYNQTFATVLIDHLLHLSAQPTPSFDTINKLVPSILMFARSFPQAAASHCVSKLVLIQKNFARGLAKGPLTPDARTWPGIPELTLLRVIGKTWSTSDFSHPVAAPAMLLMAQCLDQARVRDAKDLASGLFLCSLCLQYEELSKRYVPEALGFVLQAVLLLARHSFTEESAMGIFPYPDAFRDQLAFLKLDPSASHKPTGPINLLRVLAGDDAPDEKLKTDLMDVTLTLVGRFAEMYVSLDAFIEAFEPARIILVGIKDQLPRTLQVCLLFLWRSRVHACN
jgi:nucleolar protein 14